MEKTGWEIGRVLSRQKIKETYDREKRDGDGWVDVATTNVSDRVGKDENGEAKG